MATSQKRSMRPHRVPCISVDPVKGTIFFRYFKWNRKCFTRKQHWHSFTRNSCHVDVYIPKILFMAVARFLFGGLYPNRVLRIKRNRFHLKKNAETRIQFGFLLRYCRNSHQLYTYLFEFFIDTVHSTTPEEMLLISESFSTSLAKGYSLFNTVMQQQKRLIRHSLLTCLNKGHALPYLRMWQVGVAAIVLAQFLILLNASLVFWWRLILLNRVSLHREVRKQICKI